MENYSSHTKKSKATKRWTGGEAALRVMQALSFGEKRIPELDIASMEPGPYQDNSLEFDNGKKYVIPASYEGIPVLITIEPRKMNN